MIGVQVFLNVARTTATRKRRQRVASHPGTLAVTLALKKGINALLRSQAGVAGSQQPRAGLPPPSTFPDRQSGAASFHVRS